VNTFREQDLKRVRLISLMILVVGVMGCGHRSSSKGAGAVESNTARPEAPQSPKALKAEGSDPQFFSDFFAETGSISYHGYKVVRLNKTVHDDEIGLDIPVSYAVVRKNGKTRAVFDGVHYGAGNLTDFGLAPLLGRDSKQLIVSLTTPRAGRHWVVDLSSNTRVLFDSFDYKLGREEVYLMDLDKDGVSELGLFLTEFWGFRGLAMSQHEVLPMIVFKFDARSKKYRPANPLFAYDLEGIAEDASAIDPGERPVSSLPIEYLGKRLGILLRYVYAGKQEQGWEFFNRTYKLADAAQVKAGIRRRLQKEPVYRFIYRHRSTLATRHS
jgi:hypothetical protein